MVPIDLGGTTAVVTGATSGIGAVIAETLARAGARVVVHYRSDEARAFAVAATIERHTAAIAVRADLGDDGEVAALFERVASFGELGVLVNNAGSYPVAPLSELSRAQWASVMADNTETALVCTQAAAELMSDGGTIVNVASLSALRPAPAQSHYNSAKAALLALTMSAANELANRGIRVNAVSPGLVERPALREEWPEGVERWCERSPLARLGHPQDVANAVLFLASPLSSWITGQNLVVDGGISVSPAY